MEEWKNGPRIGAAYIRVSSDDQLEYSPDSHSSGSTPSATAI